MFRITISLFEYRHTNDSKDLYYINNSIVYIIKVEYRVNNNSLPKYFIYYDMYILYSDMYVFAKY